MTRLAIIALGLLLGGCAVSPQVDYHLLSDRPRSDAWIPYQLTDTSIAIGVASDKLPVDLAPSTIHCGQTMCTADGDTVRVGALGSPVPFGDDVLAIEPRSRHFVETSLAPTYFDGSLRLKSLDVEVKDHRLEAINTIGALAAGVAKAAGEAAMGGGSDTLDLRLPIVIDLAAIKREIARSAEARATSASPVPGNDGWTYTAAFLDDPAAMGFLSRAQRATVHGAILTSACRTLRINLKSGDFMVPTLRVIVADPDWLVAVPLPPKGTVNFHPLCGADVQPGTQTVTGSDALAEALFKQIDALRGALKP